MPGEKGESAFPLPPRQGKGWGRGRRAADFAGRIYAMQATAVNITSAPGYSFCGWQTARAGGSAGK